MIFSCFTYSQIAVSGVLFVDTLKLWAIISSLYKNI
jgi:hypothetical protein